MVKKSGIQDRVTCSFAGQGSSGGQVSIESQERIILRTPLKAGQINALTDKTALDTK